MTSGFGAHFRLLFLAIEKDRGAVLGADIIALPVQGGWIVNRKDYHEQFLQRDYIWVILDLHCLSVP